MEHCRKSNRKPGNFVRVVVKRKRGQDSLAALRIQQRDGKRTRKDDGYVFRLAKDSELQTNSYKINSSLNGNNGKMKNNSDEMLLDKNTIVVMAIDDFDSVNNVHDNNVEIQINKNKPQKQVFKCLPITTNSEISICESDSQKVTKNETSENDIKKTKTINENIRIIEKSETSEAERLSELMGEYLKLQADYEAEEERKKNTCSSKFTNKPHIALHSSSSPAISQNSTINNINCWQDNSTQDVEDYVYDIYYREKYVPDSSQPINEESLGVLMCSKDDNSFLNYLIDETNTNSDLDDTENFDEHEYNNEFDDDSNDEDYYANSYPSDEDAENYCFDETL